MNNEISKILIKLGMPVEFYDILKEELFRIAADEKMPFFKGITLYSSNTEKIVYVQRILDIMRKEKNDWKQIIETPGNVELISFNEPNMDEEILEKIKATKGIHFIDLDSFDIESEKRRCIQRFYETSKANRESATQLENEVRGLKEQKKPTFILESELENYDEMINKFKSDIDKMGMSCFSIFYVKKLKLAKSNLDYCIYRYNSDINTLNSINEYNKNIDNLCKPMEKNSARILTNANKINSRRIELENTFFGKQQKEEQEK